MRDIKFRAWHNEKMWPVRKYDFDDDGDYVVLETYSEAEEREYPYGVHHCSNCGMANPLWAYVKDCILMQYTGLKDRNGKKIYEGDIIYEHPNKHIGVIYVDLGNFDVEWDNPDYPDWSWTEMACDQIHRLEVIGNIYENRELLEEKREG